MTDGQYAAAEKQRQDDPFFFNPLTDHLDGPALLATNRIRVKLQNTGYFSRTAIRMISQFKDPLVLVRQRIHRMGQQMDHFHPHHLRFKLVPFRFLRRLYILQQLIPALQRPLTVDRSMPDGTIQELYAGRYDTGSWQGGNPIAYRHGKAIVSKKLRHFRPFRQKTLAVIQQPIFIGSMKPGESLLVTRCYQTKQFLFFIWLIDWQYVSLKLEAGQTILKMTLFLLK